MSKTLANSLTIEFDEQERGYLAYFPALAGCHTWGETYEEAVKNAEEALVGYLEALQKNSEKIPEGDHPAAGVSLGVVVNLPELVWPFVCRRVRRAMWIER
jgi:predicted RNase H-like HicB family nuclease